jgi:hypothetical protein
VLGFRHFRRRLKKRDSSPVQARQIFFVAECSFFIRLFGRQSRDLIKLNDAGSQGFLPIAKLLNDRKGVDNAGIFSHLHKNAAVLTILVQ